MRVLLNFTILSLLVGAAHSATIAQFTFSNGGAGTSDVSEHSENFSVSAISSAGGGGVSGTTGTAFARSNSTTGNNTLADAITNDEYFSFTITSPADCTASNISISADWVVTDADTNATVNYSVYLMTDMLAFAPGNELDSAAIDDQNNPASNLLINDANNDINSLFTETQTITGLGGTLLAGESLEIRIYYNDNSTSATRFHRFDNIEVTADLAGVPHVPEPSTAILGLCGLAILLRRRR